MQWLRCSEDGTCQRGALPGVALGALAVEAMVLQLVLGLLEVVCVESDYGQVYLLEGQVVLDTELLRWSRGAETEGSGGEGGEGRR